MPPSTEQPKHTADPAGAVAVADDAHESEGAPVGQAQAHGSVGAGEVGADRPAVGPEADEFADVAAILSEEAPPADPPALDPAAVAPPAVTPAAASPPADTSLPAGPAPADPGVEEQPRTIAELDSALALEADQALAAEDDPDQKVTLGALPTPPLESGDDRPTAGDGDGEGVDEFPAALGASHDAPVAAHAAPPAPAGPAKAASAPEAGRARPGAGPSPGPSAPIASPRGSAQPAFSSTPAPGPSSTASPPASPPRAKGPGLRARAGGALLRVASPLAAMPAGRRQVFSWCAYVTLINAGAVWGVVLFRTPGAAAPPEHGGVELVKGDPAPSHAAAAPAGREAHAGHEGQ